MKHADEILKQARNILSNELNLVRIKILTIFSSITAISMLLNAVGQLINNGHLSSYRDIFIYPIVITLMSILAIHGIYRLRQHSVSINRFINITIYIVVVLVALIVFSLLYTSSNPHLTLLVDAWIVIPLMVVTASLLHRNALLVVFILGIINLLIASSFVGFNYVFTTLNFPIDVYLKNIIILEIMYYIIVFVILFLQNKPIDKLLKEIPKVVKMLDDEQKEQFSRRIQDEKLKMISSMAQQMQGALQPGLKEMSSFDDYNISGINLAYEDISGDFYEISPINKRINIAFGDITGHGINTAMTMLLAQSCIKTQFYNNIPLTQMIDTLNRLLYYNIKLSDNIKVKRSLVVSLATIENGIMRICGKHESIILAHDGNVTEIKTDNLSASIGVYKDIRRTIDCTKIPIEIGDRVLFYSDGVREVMDDQNILFGVENIMKYFNNSTHLNTDEQINYIYANVIQYARTNKLQDDYSMIIIERLS